MPETPRTWTLVRDVDHMRFGVASGPSLGRDEAVEVIEKAPVDAEIEQLTDALERHKRLVARYRKPMPEGGLTSSEKLHTSHVARVDAEARAEQAEAQVRELREEMIRLAALLHFATHDANFSLANCLRRECINRRAALASSEPKGTPLPALPLRGRKGQWRWWCSSCERDTDIAPCKHCGAGHDEVLVLEPGQEPPSLKIVEADGWPTVEDFEWSPETYLNVEQGGDDD